MSFGDWFGGVADFVGGNFGDIAKVGGGLYNIFRNADSRSADAMYGMLGASVDPNNPQFRNLAALFEERNRADAMQNIKRVMTQDARGRARGGSGFIVNPERRDEFRASSLNTAFMEAGQRGRDEARTALTGAAGGFAAGIPYDQSRSQQRGNQIVSGIGGLADLFNLFNFGGQGQTFSPTPSQQTAMNTDYFDFRSEFA